MPSSLEGDGDEILGLLVTAGPMLCSLLLVIAELLLISHGKHLRVTTFVEPRGEGTLGALVDCLVVDVVRRL